MYHGTYLLHYSAITLGGGMRSAPPTPCARRTSASTPARRAAIGSSSYPRGRAAAWGRSRRRTGGSARTGAACGRTESGAGFVDDFGSWQKDRYHNTHYPDDDVGRAYRVGLARYLCLPLCEAASLCRGCGEAALDEVLGTRTPPSRARHRAALADVQPLTNRRPSSWCWPPNRQGRWTP